MNAPRDLSDIRQIVIANGEDPLRSSYEGLTSEEIAKWNRYVMFGPNDRAFPSQEEWSAIVD